MPIDYGVQGPNLQQFGGDPNLDNQVLGGIDPGSLGGAGAGFIPSQEEVRRRKEQEMMRARDPRMVEDLMQILSNLQTTSQNTGLSAGMGTPANFTSSGVDPTGNLGGRRRSQAQQFFGGALNNPSNFEAQGPWGSQLDALIGVGMDSAIGLMGPSMGRRLDTAFGKHPLTNYFSNLYANTYGGLLEDHPLVSMFT
tara:strand:+ start:142 stop:729 length:588 start_codon:yes stop_codon:yes gene_type:complete